MSRPLLPSAMLLAPLILAACIPMEARNETPPPQLNADAAAVELVEAEPVWTAQQVVANAQTVATSTYVVQPGDTLRGIGNRTGARFYYQFIK